jgi:aldose 1-epimerase
MSRFQTYTLQNSNDCLIKVTNFGGKVMSVITPDRHGNLADIALGYATPEEYLKGNPHFGALIGRYANRIANGRFVLERKQIQLPINNGPNCLHGGINGLHNVFWEVDQMGIRELALRYTSPHGEEGFPGELKCQVTYSLTDANEMIFEYRATTTQPTVINLTHHGFFNLRGAGNGDVLGHRLMLNANRYCPVDENLIPMGSLDLVQGSPFDFLNDHAIGERLSYPHPQLKIGNGYDHCWALEKNQSDDLSLAAKVYEPTFGRTVEVWTTEPGLQFYSGNFLNGSDVGREGIGYPFRSAFCLEAQHFPDSPNQPQFPTTVLEPGKMYYQKTIYKFGVN